MPVLGNKLLALVEGTREELVLCAPFVKRATAERLLEPLCAGVDLTLITRWRPEEVAAGVSDTDVLETVVGRGGTMLLCDNLHAKYFRADGEAMIGSANLTAAALGWSRHPNLELLVEMTAKSSGLPEFERLARKGSIVADQGIADAVNAAAELLPKAAMPEEATPLAEAVASIEFVPRLRQPDSLYRAYREGARRLSSISAIDALADLEALDLPLGLEREAFTALVASRLLQLPIIRFVDSILESPQRFGAVRDELAVRLDLDRFAASSTWQTIMRWLLQFLPHRYRLETPRHSEVLQRIAPE